MSEFSGRFVWYELATTDTQAAQAFYGDVVGWGTQDASVPGMAYALFTAAGTPAAGLMDQPEMTRQAGAPPGWLGYVAVDDVDAAAGKAGRLGGTVCIPPRDIPGVGRFAVVIDPQSVPFALFTPSGPGPDQPPARGAPGHIGWHELHAADWQAAFSFYAAMFGWQKADAMDMGAMGSYQIFAAGGQAIGGMFDKPPMEPAPYWLYYLTVADIDAASGRVTAGGGKVVNGPHQVPGGDWIVHCLDPQGATFALVGRRG